MIRSQQDSGAKRHRVYSMRLGRVSIPAILAAVFALQSALLAAPPGSAGGSEAEAEQVFARPGQPRIDEYQPYAGDEVAQAQPATPFPVTPPAIPEPAAPPTVAPSNFLSSSIGAASTSQTTAPFMIGDAFGGMNVTINLRTIDPPGSTSTSGSLNVAGRTMLADNFSPMPRDRLFFDYNYYNDVPLAGGYSDSVTRYAPAFEKTFFGGWSSIEMRMPVANTLNNNISLTGPNNFHQGQFGDLFLSFKTLLWRTDTLAIAGGLALTLPTASDVTLLNFPNAIVPTQLQFQNRAVDLQPYLAYLWTPNDRFYMQSLLTVDVASGGTPVNVQAFNLTPQFVGTLNNQTLLNFSIATGYWAYRNPGGRYLNGIAPIFELHQWQSISDSNVLRTAPNRGQQLTIGTANYHFQLLNLTAGMNLQLGPLSSLLLGYTTPLGSGSDKQFGSEFRLSFNRRFGPQNRLTRSQF